MYVCRSRHEYAWEAPVIRAKLQVSRSQQEKKRPTKFLAEAKKANKKNVFGRPRPKCFSGQSFKKPLGLGPGPFGTN